MSTTDYFLGGVALLVLAAASPFVYEQTTGEPPRTDAVYWAERGYAPLPQSSLPQAGENGEENF